MDMLLTSDQVVAFEDPGGAYGMIVVKETAAAIGITAVPTPFAEGDADYFVYQGMTVSFTFVSGVGVDGNAGSHYIVDSKAMRKVGPTDDIVSVFESRNAGGMFLNVEGRTLIQLH